MLRKRGLIDPDQERPIRQQNLAIDVHLASFEKSLARNGLNTEKHVRLTMTRINSIITAGGFRSASDFDEEAVIEAVVELQAQVGFGARTYNHYLQAIDSFGNWLENTRRLSQNPMKGIERVSAELDMRHQRRALTDEEIASLVRSARESGVSIQCYDGEQRARIYTLS